MLLMLHTAHQLLASEQEQSPGADKLLVGLKSSSCSCRKPVKNASDFIHLQIYLRDSIGKDITMKGWLTIETKLSKELVWKTRSLSRIFLRRKPQYNSASISIPYSDQGYWKNLESFFGFDDFRFHRPFLMVRINCYGW